jgi:hypothetical protein
MAMAGRAMPLKSGHALAVIAIRSTMTSFKGLDEK